MKQKKPDTVQSSSENLSPLPLIEPGEIIIGSLIEIDGQGRPLVDFSENTSNQLLIAMTTLGLGQQHIGRQVALLFANGDVHTPVIMGMIHSPLQDMLENFSHEQTNTKNNIEIESKINSEDVKLDGKKLIFEAKEEIVFRCGESSITLTKSGKVLIRGKYLLNRSTGVNRIMGGSVQVN